MFNTRLFFERYNKDYHQYRGIYLKSILDDLEEFIPKFITNELTDDQQIKFRQTILFDLRQNLFHAIETFFEIFFAINPHGKSSLSDVNLMYELSTSKWRDNYNNIQKIADSEENLGYLDETIKVQGNEISKGHWIFYLGFFNKELIDGELYQKVAESVNSLKDAIKIFAKEFSNRNEYNTFKHGLRSIPVVNELEFSTPKEKMKFSMKDSQTFFYRTPKMSEGEIMIETKTFDPERDFKLAQLASILISMMITYREIAFPVNERKLDESIGLRFFNRDDILIASKRNVPIDKIRENKIVKLFDANKA